MKQSEFVRWLSRRGAHFEQDAKHIKVYLNGRQSVLPRHPSAELKQGTLRAIKRQLGLE